MLDLFQITQPQLMRLEPVWICSTFIGNGIDKTKKDLERHNIAIFYPYADEFEGHERFWKNYLFIKKISNLGFLFELVHKNSKFLYFISDENGPIPVRNSEINKVKADITRGFYAQKYTIHPSKTALKIKSGKFEGVQVELISDVSSAYAGTQQKIKVRCPIGIVTVTYNELFGGDHERSEAERRSY